MNTNRPLCRFHTLRTTVLFILGVFVHSLASAQSPTPSDTNRSKVSVDTTLANSPRIPNTYWRKPQVQRNGADLYFTGEAIRYYGSPMTFPELLEESGGPYPLLLSDEAYGRESFLMTPRTSEAPTSTLIDGVLPINSILNGATLTDYYMMDVFSDISMNSGAAGAAITGEDYAASDVANFSIERYRAPVPYSSIHYTQDLTTSTSNFDGIFSLNSSPSTNFAFGIHRRTSGQTPIPYDPTFNPRTDLWSTRAQMTVTKYLGTLPHDSTMTEHKIDSILATPKAKQKTLDLLIWGQYTTAFSGLNGGIAARDSVDIFDPQIAPVFDLNTFDHRVRMDGIAELELPLLAEARTKLSAYASYESRRIFSRDSTFPLFIPDVAAGSRFGLSLNQPLAISIGDFMTRAVVQGDLEHLTKDSVFTFASPMSDTRLSATFSDSLALRAALRISLFGFARTTQSSMTLGNGPVSTLILPSIGFSGSIGLTDAISLSASYQYAKDRTALSPSPNETYQLINTSAWADFHLGFAHNDSIALHLGVLDRHEPKGIVYDFSSDSINPKPFYSNADLHSWSTNLALDAYISHFHFASSVTYFPKIAPISSYTQIASLTSDVLQRFFGITGLYYENEVDESNLRITVGPRVRFYSRLEPQLTYDRASDYYVYEGYAPMGDTSDLRKLDDSRVKTPQFVLDFLVSMEVDRRAQVNMSLLNIIGTPYYNVSIYPRTGFHWKLDVTWAFLD